MKKSIRIIFSVACVLGINALMMTPVTALKGSGGGTPIPDKVMKIADKSCVNCHSEPGNFMAISHLNLSAWDKYSPEKQAAKAKAMCNMVTKEKMPPNNYRKNHPEGVPSLDETKTICDWAQSIQVPKK